MIIGFIVIGLIRLFTAGHEHSHVGAEDDHFSLHEHSDSHDHGHGHSHS